MRKTTSRLSVVKDRTREVAIRSLLLGVLLRLQSTLTMEASQQAILQEASGVHLEEALTIRQVDSAPSMRMTQTLQRG